jgi:hypothetical protein
MSHAKLLHQRVQDAIEAGHYRSKGTPRSAERTPVEEEAKERKEPAPTARKAERKDHRPYVEGAVARRREQVGKSVEDALRARFSRK